MSPVGIRARYRTGSRWGLLVATGLAERASPQIGRLRNQASLGRPARHFGDASGTTGGGILRQGSATASRGSGSILLYSCRGAHPAPRAGRSVDKQVALMGVSLP